MSDSYEIDLARLNPLAIKSVVDCDLMFALVKGALDDCRDQFGTHRAAGLAAAIRTYERLGSALIARRKALVELADRRGDESFNARYYAMAKAVLPEEKHREILALVNKQ